MTDETEQQPRTLREIAHEMSQQSRPKRDRPWYTPIRDHHKFDQPLDMSDERALESMELPRFASDITEGAGVQTRRAAEFLQQQRKEAEDQREAEALHAYHDRHKRVDDAIRATETWSSDDEKQALQSYQARMARFQQGAQDWERTKQHVVEHVAALNRSSDPTHRAEAQRVAQQFLGLRDVLQKEHDELVGLTQQGLQHQQRKFQQANQMHLARAHPEILQENFREAFIVWLEHQGHPRQSILNEQDPRVLSQYIKLYKEHEAKQYEQEARRRIARTVAVQRGSGSDTDSESARESLRKHGRMSDAANFLHLRRQERRYGI